MARICAEIPRECNFVESHSPKFPMPVHHEESIQLVLDKLLEEHGLTPDTLLYREAEREALTPTGRPGVYRIPANARPGETVIDVYGQGYLVQAEQIGPGLAFAQSAAPNWQDTVGMRLLQAQGGAGKPQADCVDVSVRFGDILRQGGLVYPVESVSVERVWYCTLPYGSAEVREV
jgi:hypothetical protein